MSEQLKASIVRIFLKGDEHTAEHIAVGVGFLIPDKNILTCAHVVVQALGLRDASRMPEADLCLDFPFVASDKLFKARVVCWQPKNEDDIAVLELEKLPPVMARPVRLVAAQDLWGHSFRAFGFPVDYDKGVWATGVLRQEHIGRWVQIEALHVPGYRIVQGFSGTPVWDEQLDGVVGMVVESDKQASTKAAYIIPTALLVQAWPGLGQQTIPPCPYRGLFAFREIDAPFFFGRKPYIAQLVDTVQKKPLTAIIGPSGSGKSSVVFAGLAPRLSQSGNWIIASFRPGHLPFRALAAALIPLLESQMSETDRLVEINKLAQLLQKGELTLLEIIERIVQKHFDAHLLLIADQFEELYTLCPTEDERQHFLDLLLSANQRMPHQRTLSFHQIITLRADFLGHALSYRPFADALQHTDLKLGPMTHQELRDAIRRPAEKLKVHVDEGLVERILATVHKEPGNLPLLEFALTLLWKRQREGRLTLAAYEEIGGIEASLAAYADEVYNTLSEEEQAQVQQIFVQLVHPGEGTEDTRRIATRSEIGEERWKLVSLLSDARLVVSGRDESTKDETVEVVHEALIRGWKRLCGWMEREREFRLWQERLRSASRQWEASGNDKDALLRGTLLAQATQWMTQRSETISPLEQAFIERSQQSEIQEVQRWKVLYEEAERQRREAEIQKRIRDEFLLRISHDLRTPFYAIKGRVQILLHRKALLDEQILREQLEAINKHLQELTHLFEQLLDASRVEAGVLRLALQGIDVHEMLQGLQQHLNSDIPSSQDRLKITFPPHPLKVQGDHGLIEVALANLLSNAFHYAPEGETVDLGAEAVYTSDQQLAGVMLRVTVHRPDMTQEQQMELFTDLNTFAGMDRPKVNRPRPGQPAAEDTALPASFEKLETGLSLYISRGIIQAHGSMLMLKYDTKEGITFAFVLPSSLSTQ